VVAFSFTFNKKNIYPRQKLAKNIEREALILPENVYLQQKVIKNLYFLTVRPILISVQLEITMLYIIF
jgi:hypothetical protein